MASKHTGAKTRSAVASHASPHSSTENIVKSGGDSEEDVPFSDKQRKSLADLIGRVVADKVGSLTAKVADGPPTAKHRKMADGKHRRHHVVSDSDGGDSRSEGQLSSDEADAYINDLDDLMEVGKRTAPDLPEKIVGILKRMLGAPH